MERHRTESSSQSISEEEEVTSRAARPTSMVPSRERTSRRVPMETILPLRSQQTRQRVPTATTVVGGSNPRGRRPVTTTTTNVSSLRDRTVLPTSRDVPRVSPQLRDQNVRNRREVIVPAPTESERSIIPPTPQRITREQWSTRRSRSSSPVLSTSRSSSPVLSTPRSISSISEQKNDDIPSTVSQSVQSAFERLKRNRYMHYPRWIANLAVDRRELVAAYFLDPITNDHPKENSKPISMFESDFLEKCSNYFLDISAIRDRVATVAMDVRIATDDASYIYWLTVQDTIDMIIRYDYEDVDMVSIIVITRSADSVHINTISGDNYGTEVYNPITVPVDNSGTLESKIQWYRIVDPIVENAYNSPVHNLVALLESDEADQLLAREGFGNPSQVIDLGDGVYTYEYDIFPIELVARGLSSTVGKSVVTESKNYVAVYTDIQPHYLTANSDEYIILTLKMTYRIFTKQAWNEIAVPLLTQAQVIRDGRWTSDTFSTVVGGTSDSDVHIALVALNPELGRYITQEATS